MQLCVAGSHVWQAAPYRPHWLAVVPPTQVMGPPALAAQQPAQLSAVQVHFPPRHCSPAPQAGPKPQSQVPWAEQRSLMNGSQAAQLRPGRPQCWKPLGAQPLPRQQPPSHESKRQSPHTPSLQESMLAQM